MPLIVKASITQAYSDAGPGFCAEIKDFDVSATASSIERSIDLIKPKLEAYLKNTFGTEKLVIADIGQVKAAVEFEITVMKDRQLSEFVVASGENKGDDTEITVTFGDKPPIKTNMKTLALAKKQTGIPPQDLIKMAKKKKKEGA